MPKAHEGSGWSRVSDRLTNGPPPPGPPPPGPPVVVTSGPSEAEIFAEMEEGARVSILMGNPGTLSTVAGPPMGPQLKVIVINNCL